LLALANFFPYSLSFLPGLSCGRTAIGLVSAAVLVDVADPETFPAGALVYAIAIPTFWH
jgi:hypothetical protein